MIGNAYDSFGSIGFYPGPQGVDQKRHHSASLGLAQVDNRDGYADYTLKEATSATTESIVNLNLGGTAVYEAMTST